MYFLIADGFGTSSAGEYELQVTRLPPLSPLTFPATGDARQPLSGIFSSAGQFVEGIRTLTLNRVSRAEINLQVTNQLTCSAASFVVRLNNQNAGTFFIRPGDTTVMQGLTFNPVFGPNGRYNIRYEMQNTVPATCGSVQLPDNVSTISLGN